MRHLAVLFLKMRQVLSRVSFVSFCFSKTRPGLFKSQGWTDPQKSLTIPYIHGFQTEVARQPKTGLKSCFCFAQYCGLNIPLKRLYLQ